MMPGIFTQQTVSQFTRLKKMVWFSDDGSHPQTCRVIWYHVYALVCANCWLYKKWI